MQKLLFDKSLVDQGIGRIQDFEKRIIKPYYLAFSGGKDSVCLYHLARMSKVKFVPFYAVTTCDPPEVVRFIRTHYPDVQFYIPQESLFTQIVYRGLPTPIHRWCCDKIKHRGGENHDVLTGIRSEESPARRYRAFEEPAKHAKRLIHVIKDWTTSDVWGFIREYNLDYCPLYDEGWKRLGCVGCPYERCVQKSMARWPKIWARWRKASILNWGEKKERLLPYWRTEQERWNWWISRSWKFSCETTCDLFGSPGMEAEDERDGKPDSISST